VRKSLPAQDGCRNRRTLLKAMTRRGLIAAGVRRRIGFGLLPFVVGIYEYQGATIDAEWRSSSRPTTTRLFGHMAAIQPPVHRVIPIGESIAPIFGCAAFESAVAVVEHAKAGASLIAFAASRKPLSVNRANTRSMCA
jgi:hypothetical protein